MTAYRVWFCRTKSASLIRLGLVASGSTSIISVGMCLVVGIKLRERMGSKCGFRLRDSYEQVKS
eukprot:1006411-Rhodomonas_salina.1